MREICEMLLYFKEERVRLTKLRIISGNKIIDAIRAHPECSDITETIKLNNLCFNNLCIILAKLNLLFEDILSEVNRFYTLNIMLENATKRFGNAYFYLKRYSKKEVSDELYQRTYDILNAKKELVEAITEEVDKCSEDISKIISSSKVCKKEELAIPMEAESSGLDYSYLRLLKGKLSSYKRRYLSILRPLKEAIPKSPNYPKFLEKFNELGTEMDNIDDVLYAILNNFSEYTKICLLVLQTKKSALMYKDGIHTTIMRSCKEIEGLNLSMDQIKVHADLVAGRLESRFNRYTETLNNFEQAVGSLIKYLSVNFYMPKVEEKTMITSSTKYMKATEAHLVEILEQIEKYRTGQDKNIRKNNIEIYLNDLVGKALVSKKIVNDFLDARKDVKKLLEKATKLYKANEYVYESENFARIFSCYQLDKDSDFFFDEDLEQICEFEKIQKTLEELNKAKQRYKDKKSKLLKRLVDISCN